MSSNTHLDARPTRRSVLRAGAVVTTAAAIGGLTQRAALARPALTAPTFGSADYEAALAATGGVKAIFQSPHADAQFVAGDTVNHLLLLQLKNWLNGFQFSYELAPADLHTLVGAYASANILNYSDAIWAKYKIGAKYAITDPITGAPAVRNVFYPSRFGLDAPKDITAKDNAYQDTGIEALQARGTIFLACNNSLNGHAAAAIADKRAPEGMEQAEVVADLQANLIPGAVLTPAVVGEVSRAQAAGYSLVFIPIFKL